MIAYFVLFLVPMVATFVPWKLSKDLSYATWMVFGLILIIMIGLRDEVGGDWYSYLFNPTYYRIGNGENLSDVTDFGRGDYGYEFLYWFSVNYLNGIYATNLICAIIFISGLWRLCGIVPLPWMAVTISIPIFVIIVAMGYTRQATAIGFLMWGIVELLKGNRYRYFMLIIIGSLFHKTILIMLLAGYYGNGKFNMSKFLLPVLLFSLLFFFILLDNYSHLIYFYISNSFMFSAGAVPRVLINAFPAVILFYYRKRWVKVYDDYALWSMFSAVSVVLLPVAFYFSSFADRVAMYLIPAQIVILSRATTLIDSTYYRSIFVVSIFIIYISSMFVWLNFGDNSIGNWVPYNNLLLK